MEFVCVRRGLGCIDMAAEVGDSLAWKFFHVEEILADDVSLGTPLAEIVVEVVLRTVCACDLIDLVRFLNEGRIVEGVGAQG